MNEDILTTLSIGYGATGVSEALSYTQHNLAFEPRVLKQRAHDIDVFFPTPPEQEYFQEIKKLDDRIQWQVFEEKHIEFVIREAFSEAKEYMAKWNTYNSAKAQKGFRGAPPTYDLRMETLAAILRGEIIVHCHSYRADEI